MNSGPGPAVGLSTRWFFTVLGSSLLYVLAFVGLRQLEQDRLEAGARVVREYGRASNDLMTGFLHLSLDGRDGGLWERSRGYALLRQSLSELEGAARELPDQESVTSQFRQDLEVFRNLLNDDESHRDSSSVSVSLHLALARLKGTADAVDAALRNQQQSKADRYDRMFQVAMIVGLCLLMLLGSFAMRAMMFRRRLEQKLADSESQFRGLVEQSVSAVVIVRDRRIVYANPRSAEIMRCTLPDLMGRSILDTIVERDRDESVRELELLEQDPKAGYSGSLRVTRFDGTEALLDMQANPVTLNGAPALMAILHDVTEKERQDFERLEALQMVDSILKASGDALFLRDLEGRYLMFSPQAEALFGKSAAEVVGRDSSVLFGPEVVAEIRRVDSQIRDDRQVRRLERQSQGANGGLAIHITLGPIVDPQDRVTAIFGVTRDVTDLKRQEKALEESRAELVAMFDALEEGMIVFNAEGEIQRMNPAAMRINGIDFEEWQRGGGTLGRQNFAVMETLDGHPIPLEQRPGQRTLRGEQVRDFECVFVHPRTGQRRTLSCNGSQVWGADGKVRLALLTFTDVTERRRAEQAIVQGQRLESLGTLAAGIAHDFNNILLAIAGNATLAESDLPAEHPAHTSLQEVQRAGRRAKDLVRRILLFARAEESQRSTGDLREVVSEAVELMRPSLPARVQLQREYPADAVNVDMDASQIHQVVVNLITNSGHAIEDVGPEQRGQVRVELDTEVFEAPRQFGLRVMPAGRYAVLAVTDDGCGMDAAVMSRVFDPFFTTKDVGRGTGLGLAIVRGIVEEHGGSLELQSAPGKGTRVKIVLPLSTGAAPGKGVDRQAPRGGGRHVLYIDDEPALVSLVTRYLQRQGYQVSGNTDPRKALDALRASPSAFDLVVTDLSMPEMSGFDVVQAVRGISASVPILMMTGYVRPEDRDRALAMGVKEVLLKPSTVTDLCESIDRELR
ncbi:MAG: hypothetical protein RLZZ200_97 [Pseudomonadota bacterium]|jgi:PAS domain S-box-containing protein